MTSSDLIENMERSRILLSGPLGLWIRVLYLSVSEIQDTRLSDHGAWEFIFDESNIFFDGLCLEMEIDPEAARQHIKKLIGVKAETRKQNGKRRAIMD